MSLADILTAYEALWRCNTLEGKGRELWASTL